MQLLHKRTQTGTFELSLAAVYGNVLKRKKTPFPIPPGGFGCKCSGLFLLMAHLTWLFSHANMTFLSFHRIKFNYGLVRIVNTLGKVERLSEENLTRSLLYCLFLGYFKKTNIVFLLANSSSLHFDNDISLMPKSRLEKFIWAFWSLQAICSSCVSE